LLLPWLALGALASWAAAADDEAIAPSPAVRTTAAGALSSGGPPIAGTSVPSGQEARRAHEFVHQGPEVQGASYVAQHPNPSEPLGFGESRFSPHSGPLVDPAATPAVFDAPPVEFYESPDPDAPAPAVSSGDWLRNGHWYTEQSVVYLERVANPKNDLRLATQFLLFPNENALDVGLQLGYQPGLRSTIGRYLGRDESNRDHSAEFTFLGLTHWQFGESIAGVDGGTVFQVVNLFVTVPVYDNSDVQGFDQTSDFNSYELNYRIDRRLGRDRLVYTRDSSWVRQATPALLCSAFAGVRTVIVNEGIQWTAQNAIGNGRYVVVTHNNLVGPQVGSDLFYEHTYWRAGLRANAGALVNFASQSSTVRILDPNGAPLASNRDEFAKDHSLSFVGGLSFIGEYRFRPSFGLRISYDMIWVSNLALAHNQLTFLPSTPAEISNSHALFYQGVSLGFEWFR
jgi:hypothetical protein